MTEAPASGRPSVPPETAAGGWIRRSLPVVAIVGGARLVARVFGFARDTVARGMLAIGLTPNTVTVVGPLVSTPVALAWYHGNQPLGGWLLVAASSFDLLDGAVARIGGKATRFGAFFDSVMDRYSDFIMFAGIFCFVARHTTGNQQIAYFGIWALALLGALLPSYIRARAESILPLCKVGFLERAERTVTVFIGAISGNLHITLIIIAVFGNWMSIERILYTREQLEPESRRWGRFLWRYERLSPQHATMCAVLILLLIIGHRFIPRP